jgi:PDZ domain-containing protein
MMPDPAAPEVVDERRSWTRGWRLVSLIAVSLLATVVVASLFVQVPYYRLAPGKVRPVEQSIVVEGAPTFVSEGTIGYTTVSLGRATAFEALVGWIDPSVDVLPEVEAIGDQDPEENRRLNLAAMTSSKQVASVVALRHLGHEVDMAGTGAVVVQVEPDTPAEDVLEVGDTVVAVDGSPVELAEDLGEALGGHAPGDVVELTVEAHTGGTRTERVTLAARDDDPDRAFLGVASQTRDIEFLLPFTVDVDSGDVGGPSAGLAFTLGMVDVLTPGDLTGGLEVATTGTMGLDGSVGPIGGIRQKTLAVRASGADVFLVPEAEYDEARRHAGDLDVVAVADLDAALAALATRGGTGDAAPSASQQAAAPR